MSKNRSELKFTAFKIRCMQKTANIFLIQLLQIWKNDKDNWQKIKKSYIFPTTNQANGKINIDSVLTDNDCSKSGHVPKNRGLPDTRQLCHTYTISMKFHTYKALGLVVAKVDPKN